MATSAFKSTTKRSSIGANSNGEDDSWSSSNKPHRRSRSLSRFSRWLPTGLVESPADCNGAPRGKFVNTVRGSGLPEVSLDDLAIEFFSSKDNSGGSNAEERESSERGRNRSARSGSEIGRWASDTASSKSRGRSVSRHGGGGGSGVSEAKNPVSNGTTRKGGTLEANPRRRRSVSVACYQISDCESEADHFRRSHSRSDVKNIEEWKSQNFSSQNTSTSGDRQLRKSLSQKDLAHLHDGYSSHSSALTDDETKDANPGKNEDEKTIQAVYAQKRVEYPIEDVVKSRLYETMRKELRYAVEEIRTELEQVVVRNDAVLENNNCLPPDKSDELLVFSAIKKTYAAKLEQSQKRKQELLAEMMLEEQRGRELSRIVRELRPDSNNFPVERKPSRARKRSSDRMSKRLTEEAEKYFEDFISNVEDTDISSFDGERSDASSSLGGPTKVRDSTCGVPGNLHSPVGSNPCPVGTDGVVLPWLQWETSNDGSLIEKNKSWNPTTPKSIRCDADQFGGRTTICFQEQGKEKAQDVASGRDPSAYTISSHGSWSPASIMGNFSVKKEANGQKFRDSGSPQRACFDMSEYLARQLKEEALFEMYNQQHRIGSGSLLLCTNIL